MMLAAVLSLVGGGTLTSLTYQDRVEAFYAAEAGVVFAVDKLQKDQEVWTPASLNVTLPNGRSSFSISFEPSVNNLNNPMVVDGPRGRATVPADSVDLVVTGRSGTAERTVEVLIQRRGAINVDEALLASGKIFLEGEVQARGIKDLNDWSRVPAGLHSNYRQDETGVVQYRGTGAIRLGEIDGDISTVSPNDNSIQVSNGAVVEGELLVGEPERPVRRYDVKGEVDRHSGALSLPAPNTDGVTVLKDNDYYYNGDLDLLGKVKLENANLYVKGGLSIKGSLAGQGSVYVTGDTQLKGDTRLSYSDVDLDRDQDGGLGLFSLGNVDITGYDAKQYMDDIVDSLPPDHEVRRSWDDSQKALTEMSDILETSEWDELSSDQKEAFDSYRRVLGQDEKFPGKIPSWASGQERLRTLVDHLSNEPPNEKRDFLIDKFSTLADTFDAGASFIPQTGVEAKRATVLNYLKTGDTRGFLDSSLDLHYDGIDDPLDDAFQAGAALVRQLKYDGLGSAYFQGVIYTEGHLNVENHLTIVGGIIANGRRTEGPGLRPGDVRLSNGATIIYPEDVFKSGKGVGGTGQLGVSTWIAR